MEKEIQDLLIRLENQYPKNPERKLEFLASVLMQILRVLFLSRSPDSKMENHPFVRHLEDFHAALAELERVEKQGVETPIDVRFDSIRNTLKKLLELYLEQLKKS